MAAGSKLALIRGIKNQFINAYKSKVSGPHSKLSQVMDLGFTSDGAAEDYFYYLSAPHPQRTNAGEGPPMKGFGGRGFRVINHDWKLGIEWHENLEDDDQTGGLVAQARAGGKNFAILPDRVFFQIITSTNNNKLLPNVPTCADGSALYATTDGAGNARFGATNGNLLSGLIPTNPTGQNLRDAIFAMAEQYSLFLDTEGEQLFPQDDILERGLAIVYRSTLFQEMAEAVKQTSTAHVVTNVPGTENVGVAGVTNVILDSGLKIVLIPSSRVSDNSLYSVLLGEERKPVFLQNRKPLRDNIEDHANSDRTRRTDMKSLIWKWRAGFGVAGDPYMTCKALAQ